jgi:glutamate/tyrosine decarboxylase-like PLP-dependent enzyme
METRIQIPEEGRAKSALLEEMESMKTGDARWAEGRTWSMVYHVDDEHKDFLKEAAQQFFSESYINPFAFKSLQRMELEVVAMTRALLNGDDTVVGTMTSGGTESIFLAVYTYREYARKARKISAGWEMVVPETIHPAFEKAAHILGIKIIKTAIDEQGKAVVANMERAITPQTILLAVSAPSYPHGILDPIPDASELALEYELPLHVDACIGGFMLPWVERLDATHIHAWDFRLAGVTSISADTHKFGYGAKGSSVLLYRGIHILKHQFFITTDWAGGIYASATLLGSRAAGPIATAWASMQTLGQSGYLSIARRILTGVEELRTRISQLPEMEIIGTPCMNILAYRSIDKNVDIFVVADQLAAKGWYVDRQQRPNCIHITIMQHNLAVIDDYLSDLKAAVQFAKANPQAKAQGEAALYGLMARLPFRGMVEDNVRQLFEDLYGNGKTGQPQNTDPSGTESAIPAPPRWMGLLNRVLSWLPGKR